MAKNFIPLLYLLVFFITPFVYSQGFLKTNNTNIVNGDGENVILRSMGLGGWMLMEGYMMQTSSFASPQHKIEAKITELIGESEKDSFMDAWHENHCRKIDVDSLAAWGFNSIRLPMHYKLFTLPIEEEPVTGQHTWLDKGFRMVDSLLSWCAVNEMYLILDLHGAPGGQGKDAAISDYDDSKPSLWESVYNQSKTIALWRKLADRYADEPWIGGYDLINETNWDLPGNAKLKQLYVDIVNTIRAVDKNHIIYIEGNWWANDFNGLTPPFDDNMVYSFHKYWSHNDQGSIQWMLNIRNQHNVPIWCGESGENSNVWFTDAIKLFEKNNIGWAWWPMKKVESISGPLSIKKSPGYQYLLDYWGGSTAKPSAEYAKNALMELAENAKLENCDYHKDVIDAMIRQTQDNQTTPFAANIIPGIIPAANFDLGSNRDAYYDTGIANYSVSTGSYSDWNTGWAYRNDGVDIQPSEDEHGFPYNIGWIESGEWLKYTTNVAKTDSYKVKLRIASLNNNGVVQFIINNKSATSKINIPNTGGQQKWQSHNIGKILLTQGVNTLNLQFIVGGFNLNQIEFEATGSINDSTGTGNNPTSFILKQNYPNPFNSGTRIPFTLSQPARIKISVYDTTGSMVIQLVDSEFPAGTNYASWDGKKNNGTTVSSGTYYYRLQTDNGSDMKSMIFLR